ncbi:hydrogenase maturation nickel metallochaperone HypA [Halolamina rubra]|nr:hydrogenase maturation nickel metallochaperone HypA [Halolamina rubra]
MVGPQFVCRECTRTVSNRSYRALCPDCGGELGRQRLR